MNKKLKNITILIIGLVVLNIINQSIYKRFDLTSDKRYALSKTTENIISKVDNFLFITVYLEDLTGLIFSAVSLSASAQNVRILEVEQSFVPAKEETNVRRYRQSRLNKFDDFRVTAGQQVFRVQWQPGHRAQHPAA